MFLNQSIPTSHQIDENNCTQLLKTIKREVEKLSLHYNADFYSNNIDPTLFEYTDNDDLFTEFLMDVARIENENNPQKMLNYLTEMLCIYRGEKTASYQRLEKLLHQLDVYCNGNKVVNYRPAILPKFASMVADLTKQGDNIISECE